MNEQNLKIIRDEKLERGRNLRGSTTLIKCIAIVEFDDGSNWQEMLAHIPPGGINAEGYVEEVWIASEDMSIDKRKVDGETYSLLSPGWIANLNIAKIGRFAVSQGGSRHKRSLLPSRNLVVRYRVPSIQESIVFSSRIG